MYNQNKEQTVYRCYRFFYVTCWKFVSLTRPNTYFHVFREKMRLIVADK